MYVKPSRYEFRIRGRLGERLLSSFDGFDAEIQPVETILRGSVEDQAAPGTVVEVIRPGYGNEEEVLRPAAVVVARAAR